MTTTSSFISTFTTLALLGGSLVRISYVGFAMFFPPMLRLISARSRDRRASIIEALVLLCEQRERPVATSSCLAPRDNLGCQVPASPGDWRIREERQQFARSSLFRVHPGV